MAMESSDIQALAQAITAAVTEASPVKQVHISRYVGQTPWGPIGAGVRRPAMSAKFLQNGTEIRDWHVSDEDIAMLNMIKPGRYMDRKVEVIERNENGARTVEIRYSNQTIGQRMDMKNHARNFTELLQNIVTEQKPAKKEAAAAA